jgi:hypothetical protein
MRPMAEPPRYERIIRLGLVAFMVTAGCLHANPSDVPEPGRIHYVVIDDGVSDTDVRTRAGEAVRWVNVRTTPVSLVFDEVLKNQVSCRLGFVDSKDARLFAVILPDEYASLCFSQSGHRTYRVLDAHRPGVELNHAAKVRIIDAG